MTESEWVEFRAFLIGTGQLALTIEDRLLWQKRKINKSGIGALLHAKCSWPRTRPAIPFRRPTDTWLLFASCMRKIDRVAPSRDGAGGEWGLCE